MVSLIKFNLSLNAIKIENEAQPNDEYVDAWVDGKLPSLQPLDAHDTQDDIEKWQELQSNKKKFLEGKLIHLLLW